MADNTHIIEVKTKGAKKSEKEVKGVNAALGNMAKQAGLAAAAYIGSQALLGAIRSSIDLFAQQEAAEKKLSFAAGAMTESLKQQAVALQQQSRVGDEVIIAQQSYLASLGLTEQQIKDTIEASVDLAAATGMTLESAVMNTAKTLSGLAGEVGEKLGPAFRELTPEALKAGAGIQFIKEQFAGVAQADARSFAGAIDQMTNAVGDAQEALGSVLAPVVQGMANLFKSAAESAGSFFLSVTETDLETMIRKLKDAGVEVKTLEGLELINLKDQLRLVNQEIDNQGIKFKSVAEATESVTEVNKDVQNIGVTVNEDIEKREKLLGRLRGLIKAQNDGLVDQNGMVSVLNEATGVTKDINVGNLDTLIATTKASLGYAQSTVGLKDELDGVTLKTDQILDNAERTLNNAVNEGEEISKSIGLLQERENIEARIAEIEEGSTANDPEVIDEFQVKLGEFIKKKEDEAAATQLQIDLNDAYILKMREQGQMLDVMTSKEKKHAEEKGKGVKTTMSVIDSIGKLQKNEKVASVTSAISNAYEAANSEFMKYSKKYPAPTGTILGIAAAAAAVSRGLKNADEIKKAQYGADFITSGPQLMMVGEGSGPERVQVTPLVDPNLEGPQGQAINVNISGNVMHESFVEDNIIPSIREGLRLGENIGL